MKKADGIIAAAVLLVAAFFLIMSWRRGNGQAGESYAAETEAVLYSGETELGRYPLAEDRTIRIELENGYNTVVISEGTAAVSESDCANQVCVHTQAVSRVGETVVCLPHKFYIIIK